MAKCIKYNQDLTVAEWD